MSVNRRGGDFGGGASDKLVLMLAAGVLIGFKVFGKNAD